MALNVAKPNSEKPMTKVLKIIAKRILMVNCPEFFILFSMVRFPIVIMIGLLSSRHFDQIRVPAGHEFFAASYCDCYALTPTATI